MTHFHEKYHCERDQTLAVIREEFCIVNGKSVVTRIISNCLPCLKLKYVPQPQLISDLPEDRLANNMPAFSYTGEDYFGLLTVKHFKQTGKT